MPEETCPWPSGTEIGSFRLMNENEVWGKKKNGLGGTVRGFPKHGGGEGTRIE